jgi:DNA repair protein RecO
MAIHKTQAIILRRQEVRETSLILTAFTRDLGKIRGLVKGVRGARAAVPWYLEPLTLQALVLYERRRSSVDLISHFDLIDAFDPIHRDLVRLSYASFLLDLVDAMTQASDPHPATFDALLAALKALEAGAEPRCMARFLEAQLLRESGFLPATIAPSGQAGLADPESLSLSPGARMSLAQMLNTPLDRLGRLSLARPVEEELRHHLAGLLRGVLERDLKSRHFLHALGFENSLHETVQGARSLDLAPSHEAAKGDRNHLSFLLTFPLILSLALGPVPAYALRQTGLEESPAELKKLKDALLAAVPSDLRQTGIQLSPAVFPPAAGLVREG